MSCRPVDPESLASLADEEALALALDTADTAATPREACRALLAALTLEVGRGHAGDDVCGLYLRARARFHDWQGQGSDRRELGAVDRALRALRDRLLASMPRTPGLARFRLELDAHLRRGPRAA